MKREWLIWILLGFVLVPLNAIAHELGHYLLYFLFDANNIVLHYASVSADSDNLSLTQKGIAAISGPIISYVFLLLAVLFTRNTNSKTWMILGSVTTLRGLVNLPYLIARVRGFNTTPNFDEYNFSNYFNIDPYITSLVTLIILVFAILYFTSKAYQQNKFFGILYLWSAVILGLVFWVSIGKLVLP